MLPHPHDTISLSFEEGGHFAFADVVEAICDKLIRHHPHVFGAVELADSAAILTHWEQLKATERPV